MVNKRTKLKRAIKAEESNQTLKPSNKRPCHHPRIHLPPLSHYNLANLSRSSHPFTGGRSSSTCLSSLKMNGISQKTLLPMSSSSSCRKTGGTGTPSDSPALTRSQRFSRKL
ncbi:unnamed protein product [Linum trigynum]|uniref:Uncharacterized protein n=1 Tax=Linum trigynum TaxID=586398 RepID=A0AAV2F9V5_9ROSI